MEIIVGKTAGFCYGVKNAVSNAEERIKENGEIYCLGEIVHNGDVVKKLKKMGLKVVDNIEEASNKVIIRAHGIPKNIYEKAKKLNIEILDYTCPSVLNIHKIANEYSNKEYFIFLIGKKDHPETIGTISFCGNNSCIIEDEGEVENAIEKLKKSNLKNLLIIVQTTFSIAKFDKIVNLVNEKLNNEVKIEIKNTICNATKIRQDETYTISKEVQCMIIIGGKNSSNTKKLYEIAKTNCDNTFMIENKNELKVDEVKKYNKIGIMAGASTPIESINEVIELLK